MGSLTWLFVNLYDSTNHKLDTIPEGCRTNVCGVAGNLIEKFCFLECKLMLFFCHK